MASNSSWPPALKAWVQDCLSKATPSNKSNVNAELKTVLFKAHKDGTINTTDWTNVELDSLKAQAIRITHTPIRPLPPTIIPPPTLVNPYVPPPPPVVAPTAVQTNGKKRKQKKNDAAFPTPYAFSSAEQDAALAKRAARFAKPSAESNYTPPVGDGAGGWFEDDEGDGGTGGVGGSLGARLGLGGMKKRLKGGLGVESVMEVDPNVIDWDRYTIRGTSTKLEKKYLRLTSEPSPADIRPLPILVRTLQLIKEKWREQHNYAYALDQLKSMRQDLTVQRIKNEFTVEVYEIHGRIALEAKDLGEYNQCQTMLRQLYELGIKGHPQEFLSYRIIYLLHTRNKSDMASLLAQLTPSEKSDPGVHHALQVHAALATSNYVKFFRLYLDAPNMSGYIMDHFVERERMAGLAILSKAYMTLPLPYLTKTLAFEINSQTDAFLASHEAAIYTSPTPPAPVNNAWKAVKPVKPPPLGERVWDCKNASAAVKKGGERYRVVDLKGQVD